MMSSVVVASPNVNNFLSTSKSSLFEVGASFLRRLPSSASVASSSTAAADHRHNRPPHLTRPLIIPYYQQGPYKRDSVVSWVPHSPSTFFPPSSVPSFAKSLPPSPLCSTAQAIVNGMTILPLIWILFWSDWSLKSF